MKNLFGTDGIRATIGKEPLTITALYNLGNAIGLWIAEKYGKNNAILLASDTRRSCSLIKVTLESGLLLYNINVFDIGILSSPALAFLAQQQSSIGIMISASHNPYHDNGIKIINALGEKISEGDEEYISQLVYQQKFSATIPDQLGIVQNAENLQQQYLDYMLSHHQSLSLHNKKIVLDCAHGATSILAPQIFKSFGATIIAIADKPNGFNINQECGSTFPSLLQKMAKKYDADVGFAFDGDGDRVFAVNKYGDIKDGDDMLALLMHHPRYQQNSLIVGTTMSNQALALYTQKYGKKLLRVNVGDKYITKALKENNALLGGEPSGHIIMRDYLSTGDGIATALSILEVIQQTGNWEMQTFEKFPQIHATIAIKEKKDLSQPPFCFILAQGEQQLHKGRLVVRYSGTEPCMRIMVEDDDYYHARMICDYLKTTLAQEFS